MVDLGRERLLDLYRFMRTTRSIEERLARLYRQGRIAGSLYRSHGQEAIPVGSAAALEPGDLIAPLFRDLGALLVRGWTPLECFAQVLGRATSPTFGRDGGIVMGDVGMPRGAAAGGAASLRIAARAERAPDSGAPSGRGGVGPESRTTSGTAGGEGSEGRAPSGSGREESLPGTGAAAPAGAEVRWVPKGRRGTVAGTSVLGETISVMAGCALGLRMKGTDRVCLTWIGDGGTSTGGFHEGMNFAAVRRLPLIVVIENNGVAFSTPTAAETRQPDFTIRGKAYGAGAVAIDGNDAAAVFVATAEAVRRARAGEGPTVIEARTFRMEGHAEHEGGSHASPEDLAAWRGKDPIARLEKRIVAERHATDKELDALDAAIERSLDDDLAEVLKAPTPAPDWTLPGVHAEDSPFTRTGSSDWGV